LDAYDERKELTEKALAYLDQIIDGLPDSEVAENAKDIKEEYLSSYLEIQVERIISPHRPAPMSILHKNLDTLFFKILKYHKTDKNFLSDLRRADDDHKPEILSKIFQAFPQAKAFSLELNHFDDYQFHRTTGKLDNLNKGKYVIMVSDNPDFSIDHENAVLEGLRIDVSPYDMAFQGANILLTDRETGLPEDHKTMNVFRQEKGDWISGGTLKTDGSGRATFHYKNPRASLKFKVKGDEVAFSKTLWKDQKSDSKGIVKHTKIFTDRG